MVQLFDLERTSMAKYVTCAARLSLIASADLLHPSQEHCREYLA